MTKSKILFVLMIGIFALSTVMSSCKKDDKDEPTVVQLVGTTWVEYDGSKISSSITFNTSTIFTFKKYNNHGVAILTVNDSYVYTAPNITVSISGVQLAGTVSSNTMTLTSNGTTIIYTLATDPIPPVEEVELIGTTWKYSESGMSMTIYFNAANACTLKMYVNDELIGTTDSYYIYVAPNISVMMNGEIVKGTVAGNSIILINDETSMTFIKQ